MTKEVLSVPFAFTTIMQNRSSLVVWNGLPLELCLFPGSPSDTFYKHLMDVILAMLKSETPLSSSVKVVLYKSATELHDGTLKDNMSGKEKIIAAAFCYLFMFMLTFCLLRW